MRQATVLPLFGVFSALLPLCGCSGTASSALSGTPAVVTPAPVAPEPRTPPVKEPPARVTTRKANTQGMVFVTEYHNFGYEKGNMFRTPEKFAKDLKRLYDLGFRPVTASEYLNDKMALPPGASPVIMTFDDSQPTQFKLLADGSLDPKCAMGVWEKFAKAHPDFPMKGTFFVLPRMWDQPKLRAKKVAMIKEWGSELANHTVHHPALRTKNDETVMSEVAGGIELLRKYGIHEPAMFAMPYGSTPKNRALIKQFKYKGQVFKTAGAFLAGANPAPPPGKVNRYKVPRILAQPGNLGLDFWLDRVEQGKVSLYVAP